MKTPFGRGPTTLTTKKLQGSQCWRFHQIAEGFHSYHLSHPSISPPFHQSPSWIPIMSHHHHNHHHQLILSSCSHCLLVYHWPTEKWLTWKDREKHIWTPRIFMGGTKYLLRQLLCRMNHQLISLQDLNHIPLEDNPDPSPNSFREIWGIFPGYVGKNYWLTIPSLQWSLVSSWLPRKAILLQPGWRTGWFTNIFRYLKWRKPHLCKQHVCGRMLRESPAP